MKESISKIRRPGFLSCLVALLFFALDVTISNAQIPGGTLPPGDVAKYTLPLVKPPAMPLSKGSNKNKDKYKIAVRQFQQRILSPPHPVTTVWSYGNVDFPGTAVDAQTGALPGDFQLSGLYYRSQLRIRQHRSSGEMT